MGVIRYDITEEAFGEQGLPQSELSILTGMDSSSYLITDPEQKALAIRAFSHPPAETWWQTDERLSAGFKKIRLAWLGPRFTLVPARLYNGNARQTMLADLTDLKDSDTVLADALPELGAYLLYALDKDKLSEWRRVFVGCRFYHGLTPILHELAQYTRRQGRAQMYAYLRDGLVYLVGIERDRLLFCNAFSCLAAKDYLYYVLLAYEQCGWKAAQVPLKIFGEILPATEVFNLFYRYVREVEFLQLKATSMMGPQAKQHSVHLFYDLLSLQHYH